VDLDNIFTSHAPVGDQIDRYTKLRPAFRQYAEALVSEKLFTEDGDLILELAYEDIIRTVNALVPTDSYEYDQAIKFIDQAYDLAVDPNRAIVSMVQAAGMFANAAIAINE
jgi:hypothetical protein